MVNLLKLLQDCIQERVMDLNKMLLYQYFEKAKYRGDVCLKTPKDLKENLGGIRMMVKTCMQSRKLILRGIWKEST